MYCEYFTLQILLHSTGKYRFGRQICVDKIALHSPTGVWLQFLLSIWGLGRLVFLKYWSVSFRYSTHIFCRSVDNMRYCVLTTQHEFLVLLCNQMDQIFTGVLFMRIQNLVTILEILCITEKTSQRWRHIHGDRCLAGSIFLWITL